MAPGKKTGGRSKGTPNRASAERERAIAESGLTPLEYMLSILRDAEQTAANRMDAAKAAAPYVHAKLANVDLGVKLDADMRVTFETIIEAKPTK